MKPINLNSIHSAIDAVLKPWLIAIKNYVDDSKKSNLDRLETHDESIVKIQTNITELASHVDYLHEQDIITRRRLDQMELDGFTVENMIAVKRRLRDLTHVIKEYEKVLQTVMPILPPDVGLVLPNIDKPFITHKELETMWRDSVGLTEDNELNNEDRKLLERFIAKYLLEHPEQKLDPEDWDTKPDK